MQHLVIVFLHVASAMGIVASFGIESLVLTQLRAARTATDARTVVSSYRYSQRAGAASLIVTVVTGIYLATAYCDASAVQRSLNSAPIVDGMSGSRGVVVVDVMGPLRCGDA